MEPPIEGALTVVRRATVNDADLLVSWHADPDVSAYWDDETFTHDEMVARLQRPDVHPHIIEANGAPVGYVQVWFSDPDDECGIDMFLIPDARGRGYGPDAARALARKLIERDGRPRVTVDPYLWNERAVRAWSKAGFRSVEERPAEGEHVHAWLLMEMDANSFEM